MLERPSDMEVWWYFRVKTLVMMLMKTLVMMLAMGMVRARPLEGDQGVGRHLKHDHSEWWQDHGQPQRSRKEKSFGRSILNNDYIQCRPGQVKGIHGKCSTIHVDVKITKEDLFRKLKSLQMKKKEKEKGSFKEATSSKHKTDKYDLKKIVKHNNKHINDSSIGNTSTSATEKINTIKVEHVTENVAVKDDTSIKDDITIFANDAESDDLGKVKPASNISTVSEKTTQPTTELPTTGAEMFTENFGVGMGNLVIKPTNQAARDVTNQGNEEQNEELVTQTEYTVGNSPSTTATIIHDYTGMMNAELTTMQPVSYQEGWITEQTTVEPLMDQAPDIEQEIASYSLAGEMEMNQPTQTLHLQTTTQKILSQTLQSILSNTTPTHSSHTTQSMFPQATLTSLAATTQTFQSHTTIFSFPQTFSTVLPKTPSTFLPHTTQTVLPQNTQTGTSEYALDHDQNSQTIFDQTQKTVLPETAQTVLPPTIQTVLPQTTQNFLHQTTQTILGFFFPQTEYTRSGDSSESDPSTESTQQILSQTLKMVHPQKASPNPTQSIKKAPPQVATSFLHHLFVHTNEALEDTKHQGLKQPVEINLQTSSPITDLELEPEEQTAAAGLFPPWIISRPLPNRSTTPKDNQQRTELETLSSPTNTPANTARPADDYDIMQDIIPAEYHTPPKTETFSYPANTTMSPDDYNIIQDIKPTEYHIPLNTTLPEDNIDIIPKGHDTPTNNAIQGDNLKLNIEGGAGSRISTKIRFPNQSDEEIIRENFVKELASDKQDFDEFLPWI